MKTDTLNLEPIMREIARDEAARIVAEKQSELQRSEYITLADAKIQYHLFGATLYRKIRSGALELKALGGRSLLKRSEVEALIVQCPPRKRPTPPKGEQHWKAKAKKARTHNPDND